MAAWGRWLPDRRGSSTASGTFAPVPDRPVFYFDYSSPYAYLAAMRIGEVLPDATWRPIAFGILIRRIGKVPWSLRPGREAGMREIEERAAARGLPPVRPGPVLDAAEAAGLDRDAMAARLENPAIKERLRTYTDDAIAGGVTGVPTVAVGGALFWGRRRLTAAVRRSLAWWL